MRKLISCALIVALLICNTVYISNAENDKKTNQEQTIDTNRDKVNRKKTEETFGPKIEEKNKDTEKKEDDKSSQNKDANGPEILSDAAILVNKNTGKIL